MKKLVISIVLVNLLAACASQQGKDGMSGSSSGAAGGGGSTSAMQGGSMSEADMLAKRSVYYPFDVSAVQDADKPVVAAHARKLAANPGQKVRLEGNADERGSNEYNLALGQRRADGVKKMLELGGAKSDQIDSISYGEEKPSASGHDEASWSQNRRTDINYK